MYKRQLLIATLVISACTTFHLPQVFLRGSFTPATSRTGEDGVVSAVGEAFAFQAGISGHLGDSALPEPPEEPEPMPVGSPLLGAPSPCRVPPACGWERRALAEARARVIGGAP